MYRSAFKLLAVALLSVACNKTVVEPQEFGYIRLAVSSDVEVVADTKAGGSIDCSGFLVNVSGETFIGNPYSENYIYGEITGDLQIPFGTYVVAAQNCDADDAAPFENVSEKYFGCAHYRGESEQFSVLSTEIEPVRVECTMQNGKVTLTFDSSFLEDFTDVSAHLSVGECGISLTSEEAASSDVYFNVAETGSTLTYVVSGTIAGKVLTYSNTMTLSPAKWAKITIKSNHNGLIGPDINVDESMDGNGITEIINPDGTIDTSESNVSAPSIMVDTYMDDAVVVDCVLDVL